MTRFKGLENIIKSPFNQFTIENGSKDYFLRTQFLRFLLFHRHSKWVKEKLELKCHNILSHTELPVVSLAANKLDK